MKTPHRLATILFADISGYTALMEKDENTALEYLQIFHSLIEKDVASNEGEIQGFYGDGCVVSFHGSTDAVNCAVQLQKGFWIEYQIPVRIGIHTGEVVFNDSNVYGNAVNIASRIESIGIPGSVLLSRAVANQVANNLNIKMTSLGFIEFKNLTDAIEVMAISDFNFQVPEKANIQGKLKYPLQETPTPHNKGNLIVKVLGVFLFLLILIVFIVNNDVLSGIFGKVNSADIKENGLFIPPFENQTGDSIFDKIGSYTSLVIASAIQSTGMAIIKDKATLDIGPQLLEAKFSNFSSTNSTDIPSDVRFVLYGLYHKIKDTLIFDSRLVDVRSNTIVKVFPTVTGPVNNYAQLIDKLKNEILGYWATKDLPLYKYNPPNFQSYLEYLLAIENWEGDTELVLNHIKKSKKLDSTFYRSYLLELELYDNENAFKADSMVRELETIKHLFSPGELTLYNAIKARVRNMNKAAFQYFMQEFENAPRNLYVNTSAMNIASILINDPRKAIEIGEFIDWKKVPYNDCSYCQDRLTVQARAYIDIGKPEKALEILRFAETSETDLLNRGIKELEIRALAQLGQVDKIKEVIQKSRHQEFNQQMDATYFTYWASKEMLLVGKNKEANEFAQQFFDEITPDKRDKYITSAGSLHLYLGHYDQAEKDLKEALKIKNLGKWEPYFETLVAVSLGFQGKYDEANEAIIKLSSQSDKSNKDKLLYYQAFIHVGTGNIEEAVSTLKDAIYAGKRFYRWEFQNDPILKLHIPEKQLKEIISLLH